MIPSILVGLASGGGYALLGLSIVFVYRIARVVNVASSALGAIGAFAMVASANAGCPAVIAVGVGIVAGAAASLMMGAVVVARYEEASESTKIGVAIAMLVGVVTAGGRLTGRVPYRFPEILPSITLPVAGVVIDGSTIAVCATASGLVAVLWYLGERTRLGLEMRALSESPALAEGVGINTRGRSLICWAASGALNAVAMMLVASTSSPDFISLSLLAVPGVTAAAIGALRSFWGALVGGLGLGLVEGVCSRIPAIGSYRGVVAFVAVLCAMLWSARHATWNEVR